MTISGKSILIIDDDAGMLRALTRVLSGEGAIVTSAGWAGEAMEHLTDRSERFDLIITDLRMPILGGQTILGAVTVALPKVPVIIITAFSKPELKDECLRQGAAAFLEKPLDTPQLLEAVEQAFLQRRSSPRAPRRRGVRKVNSIKSGLEANLFHQTKGPAYGKGSV